MVSITLQIMFTYQDSTIKLASAVTMYYQVIIITLTSYLDLKYITIFKIYMIIEFAHNILELLETYKSNMLMSKSHRKA